MVLEGKDINSQIPRKSFKGDRIPNSAIFLKRTALEFLQILFSSRAKGSFHYDPDDTKTEIQIADVNAANLDAIDLRPAIIVVRGPLQFQGLGLGANSLESVDVGTGSRTYSDLLMGSISISCFSREAIEAEQIAHLVFNSFKYFGTTLRKNGFFSIKSLNIGAESLIEQAGDSDERYVVPVYVTALIQDRWTLDQNAGRRLEDIIISGLNTTFGT